MENYLQNRFKLDGNLYCRDSKIEKEMSLIKQLQTENKEEIFKINYKDIVLQYENNENFSNDSDEYDSEYNQQYESTNRFVQKLSEKKIKRLEANESSVNQYNHFTDIYPSRGTYKFKNGIQISSNFDSGNLMDCSEITKD